MILPPPLPLKRQLLRKQIPIPTPHQENSSAKPTNSLWFTFDYIPKVKWLAIFQEFSTWIDV